MANLYPPGPQPKLWGMNIVMQFRSDTVHYLKHLADTFDSDIVHYQLGPQHAYMIKHPDLIRAVLVTNAKKVVKWKRQKEIFGKFDGDGLVNSDGDFWRRQRKMVQPAFHSQRIGAYAEVMTRYTLDRLLKWQAGQTVNVGHEMALITRDIVAKTLFNSDVSAETERIGDCIQLIQVMAFRDMGAIIPVPDWLPLPNRRQERAAMQDLDQIIRRIIRERREAGRDEGDLLSMLLQATDESGHGMTDTQARDEAMTLFIAGHETTATALAWTYYLLATHPEVEAKLLAEVDALGGRPPGLSDLANLRYGGMVVKEAMRLYPPTYFFPREVAEDFELGGYLMRPGDIIHLVPYVTHRDSRWWDEPEMFRPERFTPEAEAARPDYAYFPFGGGPRVCIGNSFAMMEMQLILAAIAQRYRLRLAEGQGQPLVEPLIVLQPKGGIQLRVEPR